MPGNNGNTRGKSFPNNKISIEISDPNSTLQPLSTIEHSSKQMQEQYRLRADSIKMNTNHMGLQENNSGKFDPIQSMIKSGGKITNVQAAINRHHTSSYNQKLYMN